MMVEKAKVYAVAGPGPILDPSYDRVARALNDAELEEEILGGLGEPEYQLALLREADRRGQTTTEKEADHGRS